jgi:hypothetical protein
MKQLIYRHFGPGSGQTPAGTDALWSGGAATAPVVLPPAGPAVPEQHGKGDRLPAGLPDWARAPTGNPFATAPGGVQGVPGEEFPSRAATPPRDKYQQAAVDWIAEMKARGMRPENGYSRMLNHGALVGLDGILGAGLVGAPGEMIKRHTLNYLESYRYAKALEDQLLEDAQNNTGWLGTGLDALGGVATGSTLAKGGVTAARFLTSEAGLLKRAAASAFDSGVRNGIEGFLEGHGLHDSAINAARRTGEGALFGAAMQFLPFGWAGLKSATSPILNKFRT